VTLPEAANTNAKPDTQEQTVLAVDSRNRYWVNGIEVPKSDLGTRIKSVLEDKTERVVLIKGDTDASYGAVMDAMDDLRKAQIEDIGLITEQKRVPGAPAAPGTGGGQ
jgi:biopolymer transport protein TolR